MNYEKIIANLSVSLAMEGINEDVVIHSNQLFDLLYLEQVQSPLRSYEPVVNAVYPTQFEYRFHHGKTIVRKQSDAGQIQKIYDREVHFQIICIWDAGFEVSVGDGLTGYGDRITTRIFDTAREALDWLDSETNPQDSPQT